MIEWVTSFFSKPIGWPTHVIAMAAFTLMCWSVRIPEGDLPFLLTALGLWLWVLLTWTARPFLRLLALAVQEQPLRMVWQGWRHWMIAPLILIANTLVFASDLPFRAAFWYSRSALEKTAHLVLAGGEQETYFWAGVFPIYDAKLVGGGVKFQLSSKRFPWGSRGFYYRPQGQPVAKNHIQYCRSIDSEWCFWIYGGW